MSGCITQDYKDIIVGLVNADTAKEMMGAIITAIPLCKDDLPAATVREIKTRKVPEPWGIQPVYMDETGRETTFSSPSALVKHLGLPVSGIQCDAEGTKCKASSVVEIMRINGFIVEGNGVDPKKASEGGKTMTVVHPEAFEAKRKGK